MPTFGLDRRCESPFESESFGIAVLNQVVDHFTIDENRRLFPEVHRILRRDGSCASFHRPATIRSKSTPGT